MPIDHSATEPAELVALHIDATSFDAAEAEPRGVAAIRIRGPRILTGSRHTATFAAGAPAGTALAALRAFVGERPLVGYYLDFTVAVLDRALGASGQPPLPPVRRIEVSSLYYDRKSRVPGKSAVDLRLDTILRDLDLPAREGETAFPTALAAALVYRRLVPPPLG